MTIRSLVEQTKKNEPDISGIIVSVEDGKSKEIYFGELEDMPEKYYNLDIIKRSTICASCDEKRNGANVLVVDFN